MPSVHTIWGDHQLHVDGREEERSKGQERHCARAECAVRGAHPDTFESVEHAYCDCPSGAAPVWEWALARWADNTGEKLQQQRGRYI